MADGSPYGAKFAFANVAASATDSALVTAVAGKRIRVLSATFVGGTGVGAGVTFNTKPAGAGSAISALFTTAANGGQGLPYSPVGHFQTAVGEGLSVTTGAGTTTGVQLVYDEVGWSVMDVRVVHEHPRMGVSGSVVVCCIHGAQKRAVTNLVADVSREQVSQCLCCLSLYAHEIGDPVTMRCHDCRPRRSP